MKIAVPQAYSEPRSASLVELIEMINVLIDHVRVTRWDSDGLFHQAGIPMLHSLRIYCYIRMKKKETSG